MKKWTVITIAPIQVFPLKAGVVPTSGQAEKKAYPLPPFAVLGRRVLEGEITVKCLRPCLLESTQPTLNQNKDHSHLPLHPLKSLQPILDYRRHCPAFLRKSH